MITIEYRIKKKKEKKKKIFFLFSCKVNTKFWDDIFSLCCSGAVIFKQDEKIFFALYQEILYGDLVNAFAQPLHYK